MNSDGKLGWVGDFGELEIIDWQRVALICSYPPRALCVTGSTNSSGGGTGTGTSAGSGRYVRGCGGFEYELEPLFCVIFDQPFERWEIQIFQFRALKLRIQYVEKGRNNIERDRKLIGGTYELVDSDEAICPERQALLLGAMAENVGEGFGHADLWGILGTAAGPGAVTARSGWWLVGHVWE